jgi:beta-carotene hydroxylase
MSAVDMNEVISLTPEEERALAKEEREIAQKYKGGVPLILVAWGLINPIVWLSLWPLTFLGIIPLWLGFIIASFNMILSYLPGHEAEHNNIGGKGRPYRWLNELVGHMTFIPIVLPFNLHRISHLQHHAFANDPEKDPDYASKASGWTNAIWKSILSRQPGTRDEHGQRGLSLDEPKTARALKQAIVQSLIYYAVLAGLAWSGFALEALLLWWLPRQIGYTYLQVFLSWAPHHPAEKMGRYGDTRGWRFKFGTWASSAMEFHIIHHLHPNIPLHKTPAAYWDMKHILEKRGCQIDGL